MTTTREEHQQIASTILQQMGVGVMMSLGTRDKVFLGDEHPLTGKSIRGGLMCRVGHARGGTMRKLIVALNGLDLYDIQIVKRTGGIASLDFAVEYEAHDVYAEDLPGLLLRAEGTVGI